MRHRFQRRSYGLQFEVELEIDFNEVARALAARAIKNKTGVAKGMKGDIVCRVVQVNGEPFKTRKGIARND